VIGSLPIGSVDVVTAAIPFTVEAVPRVVAPLLNVTLPDAVAGRVAVKITDWFTTDGLMEDVRVSTGLALLTASVVDPVAEL
jgi:hypothetical protein